MIDLRRLQRALGGEISGGQLLCPGPGHSATDRSLSVKPDKDAPDGLLVHSFAGDDPIACKDHVRERLGLSKCESKGKSKKDKRNSAKPWSPILARYVYRKADGTPHLQVCRTQAKGFFQNKWNGQMWVTGKADGPKIPYRLPKLLAAPLTAKVHITEGEKDADNLAKLGFVSTTTARARATGRTISMNTFVIGTSTSMRIMTKRAASVRSGLRAPLILLPQACASSVCPTCR
jgi:hypothetical protein